MWKMNAEPTISVRDDADGERYEIRVDGELAGHIEYRAAPGEIALVHTEVDDRFEGRGLAGKLTAFALDDARRRGLAVLPFCPFARGYIQRHREYEDLVPAERRAQFDL
jgi:predicted GNAT family acetyltransferase